MIEEETPVIEELLLSDADFPDNYVNMAHPEDYTEVDDFTPQFIVHNKRGRHDRLIVRAAWKTSEGTMVPMSFVCHTGAPSYMYLSPKARDALWTKGLLKVDERGNWYAEVHRNRDDTFLAGLVGTPQFYNKANMLGLKALKKLQLHLSEDSFSFNSDFLYM